MTATPDPQPGWYPDPSDPSRQRYFDGNAWTENYAPLGAPTPLSTMPTGLKIGLGVGAALLVLIALASVLVVVNTTGSLDAPPSAAENATAKAERLLGQQGAAFSKQGLIKQLESEKFSTADATSAVEHIEANGAVDWNEEAVMKAESYSDLTSLSLPDLVKKLESDGFTPSQAEYGATEARKG